MKHIKKWRNKCIQRSELGIEWSVSDTLLQENTNTGDMCDRLTDECQRWTALMDDKNEWSRDGWLTSTMDDLSQDEARDTDNSSSSREKETHKHLITKVNQNANVNKINISITDFRFEWF